MIKTPELTQAINSFSKAFSQAYSLQHVEGSPTVSLNVNPAQETKLIQAVIEGQGFLKLINLIDVDQVSGQVVTVGTDTLATGRSDSGRFGGVSTTLSASKYELQETDTRISIPWTMMSSWLNQGAGNFNRLLVNYCNAQVAADMLKVGWRGASVARPTNPATNKMGEDVNIGWHARVKRDASNQIVTDAVYFDPDGAGDYKTLDALANSLKLDVIKPEFQHASDLVVLVGQDLISAAQYKLYDDALTPTEHNEAQILSRSIAGMKAYTPPYFPGGMMAVTSLNNLSIYWQRGTKRRKVHDNDDKACFESTFWRMEDFPVEQYGKYAAFDNGTIKIEPKP